MALIPCPECKTEVSDKAPTCPKCGVPISTDSKVIVYGYEHYSMLVNPKVEVFWNGESQGIVSKGDMLEFDIDTDGEVLFKVENPLRKGKKKSYGSRVSAGKINKIKISWDRITGRMIPQNLDMVTGDSARSGAVGFVWFD